MRTQVDSGGDAGPDPEGGPGADADGITEQEAFAVLAAPRRREALRYLESVGGEATLQELVDGVAEREGVGPDAPASETKRVYVSVYQTHVPRLAAAGVVDYDPESRRVRLTPRAAALLPLLAASPAADGPGARGLLSRLLGRPPVD